MTRTATDPDRPPQTAPPRAPGILAGLRIRKKLMVLHTSFSLALAVMLLVAIRPALTKVIIRGEQSQARVAYQMMLDPFGRLTAAPRPTPIADEDAGQVTLETGSRTALELTEAQAERARSRTPDPINLSHGPSGAGVLVALADDSFAVVRARNTAARRAANLVYALLIGSLLAGYAFVVVALEALVLPRHVYTPIRAILRADQAVQAGDRTAEIIPSAAIPADELGEIMRSRNHAVSALRRNQSELAVALDKIEHTAVDLRKKNHLLESARRNMEGTDRLASLGMMSAGIAHELNTPLAVVKGLVEKLADGQDLSVAERALLARVVQRLEKLSDGLLDFARVRPPKLEPANLAQIVEDAWLLVRLDASIASKSGSTQVINRVPESIQLSCDPDRLVQVFVNLVRNAMGMLRDQQIAQGRVEIDAEEVVRDNQPWIQITVTDNGPGIPSEVLERLFEPFVSSRLDSKGTGLGLAVSSGIVREHQGILIARNLPASESDTATDAPTHAGAVFEILLPAQPSTD